MGTSGGEIVNMAEHVVKERRSNKLVENMLTTRKQLLALLFQFPGVVSDDTTEMKIELFEDFCQILVDYIAAGHFGLYARIAEGQERRKAVSDLAANIYPRIAKTTEVALAFNEKYEGNEFSSRDLPADLSRLGEEMTTRIELEDQLIQKMLS